MSTPATQAAGFGKVELETGSRRDGAPYQDLSVRHCPSPVPAPSFGTAVVLGARAIWNSSAAPLSPKQTQTAFNRNKRQPERRGCCSLSLLRSHDHLGAEDIGAAMLCCSSRLATLCTSELKCLTLRRFLTRATPAPPCHMLHSRGQWSWQPILQRRQPGRVGRTTVHCGHVRLFKCSLCNEVLLHVMQVGDLPKQEGGAWLRLARSHSIGTRERGGRPPESALWHALASERACTLSRRRGGQRRSI